MSQETQGGQTLEGSLEDKERPTLDDFTVDTLHSALRESVLTLGNVFSQLEDTSQYPDIRTFTKDELIKFTTKASFVEAHQTYELDPYLAEITRTIATQILSKALAENKFLSMNDISIRIEHDGQKIGDEMIKKVSITNPDAPYVVHFSPWDGSDNAMAAVRKRALDLKADINPSAFRPDTAITSFFAHRHNPWKPYSSAIFHHRDQKVQSSLSMDGETYSAYRGTITPILVDRVTRERYFVDISNIPKGVPEIRVFVADYKYDFPGAASIMATELKRYGAMGVKVDHGTRTITFQVDTTGGTVASTSNILRVIEEFEALIYADYRPTEMFKGCPGKFASLKASNIGAELGCSRGRGYKDKTIDGQELEIAFPYDLGDVNQNPDINVLIAPAEMLGDSEYGDSAFCVSDALSRCPELIDKAAKQFILEQEGSTYTIPGFTLEQMIDRGTYKSIWRMTDSQGNKYIGKILDLSEEAYAKLTSIGLTVSDMLGNEGMIRTAANSSPYVGIFIGMRGDGQTREGKRVFYIVEHPFETTVAEKYPLGGRVNLSEIVEIGYETSHAIAAGHELKEPIIHSDIKPSNLGITDTGEIRVIDYGIARRIRESTTETKPVRGSWIGTIDCSPAELYETETPQADERSDVAMIGNVLYRLATGYHPFSPHRPKPPIGDPERPNYEEETIDNKLRSDYSHLYEHLNHLPVELSSIIKKAMDRDPTNRYPSASELRDELNVVRDMNITYNNIKSKVLGEVKGSDPGLYLDPHLKNTEEWLRILNPSATYAQRLGAIIHDYERMSPDAKKPENYDSYPEYKAAHAEQCAKMAEDLAQVQSKDQEFISKLATIVRYHDTEHLDPETPFYKEIQEVIDADSISFFQVNFDHYLKLHSGGDQLKTKVAFMYNRMSDKGKELLHRQTFFDKAQQYISTPIEGN